MNNNTFTYPYALNEEGKPVCIEEITNENRRDCKYHCYGCGAELFPVLGKIREHHFRHEKGSTCDPNKYLHEFAKAAIKKRFDENESFIVEFHAHQQCAKKDECDFYKHYHWPECERDGLYPIDLKKYYDTCTPEEGYYQILPDGKKRYIADLKLTHSNKPENKQVCIEVWVTHECTDDKKQNGGRIIEIKVTKESDALRKIIECDDSNLPIRFFNFKKNIIIEPSHKLKHIKIKYVENKPKRVKEESICSEGLIFDGSSPYEIIIDSGLEEQNENKLFAVLCNRSESGIIMAHHLWCKNGKLIQRIKRNGSKLRYLTCGKRKCHCERFQYDEKKGEAIFEQYKDIPFWEKKGK